MRLIFATHRLKNGAQNDVNILSN